MSDQQDDKVLEDYLKGGSELSRMYQAGKQEEPPANMGAAIIQAARAAVTKHSRPLSRNWYVPLSLAAVVIVGVSVVFKMYEHKGQQLLSEPGASYFMLEEKIHSSATGESDNKGPAAQSAPTAPTPPALETGVYRQQERLKQNEINTKEALKREAQKMSEQMSQLPGKEKSMQRAPSTERIDLEADIPSMESYSTRNIPAKDHAVEHVPAPATTAPLSEAEFDDQYQPASIPEETSLMSDTLAEKSEAMPETVWLTGVRQLWEAGKKDEAVASLEQFLKSYPHYPHEAITAQLPVDFDPAKYVSDFEKY